MYSYYFFFLLTILFIKLGLNSGFPLNFRFAKCVATNIISGGVLHLKYFKIKIKTKKWFGTVDWVTVVGHNI